MNKIKKISYLDNAATTKVDERVLKEMLPYFTEIYGNASSNHEFGKEAKKAIEKARTQVAELINADPKEIIFTSGATEAINMAIKGFMEANINNGNHIITVKTEHKAVLATCEYLETKGIEVTYLEVDKNGLISMDQLRESIRHTTVLIVVMYVNNEIGIIQPIENIGAIAKEQGIAFLTDATQAVGKVPIDVLEDHIDMLCFSAHKLYGPKGIGILYKRNNINITPLLHGGGQESEMRGGTYNTPLIVGLGKACELASQEFNENVCRLLVKSKELEDYFENNNIGTVNFKDVKKAPHILSITLNNDNAEDYLIKNAKKFAASTGSACNSELLEKSHVLELINKSSRTIRLSLSVKSNYP